MIEEARERIDTMARAPMIINYHSDVDRAKVGHKIYERKAIEPEEFFVKRVIREVGGRYSPIVFYNSEKMNGEDLI